MALFLEKMTPAPLEADRFSDEFTSWLALLVDTLNETIGKIQSSLTNIKINATADIGGGGAGPISVAVSGLTAASPIVATIASSTNTVAVAKCIGTATGFDITFTGDPGAACVVNYSVGVVSQ